MNLNVMMSSGDLDEFEDVLDTMEGPQGQLLVVADIDGDEAPGWMKTMTLHEEIDQGPDLPPMTKHKTVQVVALYAPGMWMKVDFLDAD